MINNSISDQVEKLKLSTETNIKNLLKCNTPVKLDIELHRRYSYELHGKDVSIYQNDSMLFVTNGIPFAVNQIRHSFQDTLDNLVKSKEVYPFFLFIEGKFIKWSNITIIKDCKYSYIFVKGTIKDACRYNLILFPYFDIDYHENVKCLADNTLKKDFLFDNSGIYSQHSVKDAVYTTFISTRDNVLSYQDYINSKNSKIMNIDPKYNLYPENTFTFVNGLYENLNPEFRLTTFWNLSNEASYYTFFTLYYNTTNNPSMNNIELVANPNKVMVNNTAGFNSVDFFTDPSYYEHFDFEYDRDISYEDNILNSLKYIMKYNPNLMNDMFKKKSNIVSRYMTGKDIKAKADSTGYVTMSRRINSIIDNHVIIFHNGNLYSQYSNLIYRNKNFLFPISGVTIADNDIFEIVIFKNIDNRSMHIKLNSYDDNIINVDPSFNMDNMKLFTTTPEHKDYNTEYNDSILYEIAYSYSRESINKIKMNVDNNFYYDKTLALVSKRQFRYTCKIATQDMVDFVLPSEFNYANDNSHYMVFVNGKRMDNNSFRITTIKSTRPFDSISAYVNIQLKKGDKFEVFYIGDELEEVYNNTNLNLSGTIVLDRSKLSYGMDKDLYMVFVNGKKVLPSQMYNIDSNKVQIRTDCHSTKNVSIVKCVEDDELIKEIFQSQIDDLSSVYSKHLENVKLSFADQTMSNTEADYKANSINMKHIMNKLIRDYWLRPYINQGEEFIYDYDDKFLDKDMNGNIILSVMDGNLDESK